MTTKTTVSAKDRFQALEIAADEHRHATGDWDPFTVLASARNNAADTAREEGFEPYTEEYWEIALGSIQDALEGNGLYDVRDWLKAHRFTY